LFRRGSGRRAGTSHKPLFGKRIAAIAPSGAPARPRECLRLLPTALRWERGAGHARFAKSAGNRHLCGGQRDEAQHAFALGVRHDEHERRTWGVVALTAAMMLVEIVGGSLFGSIALIADGWHMATHVIALAIAGFAYLFARRHARDARFSLGTGKFGDLAAFASAIILGLIAVGVGYESVLRLFHPVVIHFEEAVPIAGLGLCVNLASAWLLRVHHDHDGDHVHPGSSHHHADQAHRGLPHRDTNFRAAYVHVLADAVTSVGAIAGLSLAWAAGWSFMDPLVGLLGTIVMVTWALSLIRSAGSVLLDAVPDPALSQIIRQRIETEGDRSLGPATPR
jgi:cation diffusion facilitator family transporter